MSKNVMFLDDNQNRLIAAIDLYKDVPDGGLRLARTAGEAIAILSGGIEWDVVSLDHDLGGAVFVDSNREDCGMEVVRWIVANKPSVKEFIVHSWNTPAAYEMARKLSDAGYTVILEPFSVAQ